MPRPGDLKPKPKNKMKKRKPKLIQKADKKSSKDRMMYYGGGVVQYKDIKDKVKKCDAKAGMNTMK